MSSPVVEEMRVEIATRRAERLAQQRRAELIHVATQIAAGFASSGFHVEPCHAVSQAKLLLEEVDRHG